MPFFAEKLNWNRSGASRKAIELFPTQGNDDLFVAAAENYAAIFDSLHCDLVNLRADLKTKYLSLGHRFTVDDCKARRAIERDRADEECARRNFTLISSA